MQQQVIEEDFADADKEEEGEDAEPQGSVSRDRTRSLSEGLPLRESGGEHDVAA